MIRRVVRRTGRWALLLLLAACAQSNESILAELEQQATARPDAGADALIDRSPDSVPRIGPARAITLPLGSERLPTVQGRVNGAPLPLMLDSGASLVSLSGPAARAARLYLPRRPEERAISPGFDALYRMGVFDSLDLGGLRFGRGVASVPLRDAVSGSYGIVGCTVLGQYRVTFDFKRRTVRLEPGHGAGRPFFVPARIGGRTYWLLVDSGATRVYLEPWAALELGLISERAASSHGRKSDAFRSGRVTRIRIESMEVAGREFEDVAAGVVHTFGKRGKPAGLLGLVGLGELVWTLDFAAQTIRVKG